MGRTACTESQCLYKGALYLYLLCCKKSVGFRWTVMNAARPVCIVPQCANHAEVAMAKLHESGFTISPVEGTLCEIWRGEESASRPGRSLPRGKTRYPLYRRLGGLQGRSGQVRKISPPPGFDPRIAKPVASCCTDYATRPMMVIWYCIRLVLR